MKRAVLDWFQARCASSKMTMRSIGGARSRRASSRKWWTFWMNALMGLDALTDGLSCALATRHVIAGQCLAQHGDQWTISRQEDRMRIAACPMGRREVQANQRL